MYEAVRYEASGVRGLEVPADSRAASVLQTAAVLLLLLLLQLLLLRVVTSAVPAAAAAAAAAQHKIPRIQQLKYQYSHHTKHYPQLILLMRAVRSTYDVSDICCWPCCCVISK